MKNSLVIEGKNYISARQAAGLMNYTQDYVGQLCRSGKLDCKMVGRSWFVTEESLLRHRNSAIEAIQERVNKFTGESKDTKKVEARVEEKIVTPNFERSVVLNKVDVHPVPLKYESVEVCLLPELNKKIKVEDASTVELEDTKVGVQNTTISHAVPQALSAFYVDQRKAIVILLVCVTAAMSAFAFSVTSFPVNQKQISSAVRSTTNNIAALILGVTKSHTAAILNSSSSEKIVQVETRAVGNTGVDNVSNGIVVTPSSGSATEDDKQVEEIKNYFSDEVNVMIDKSGNTGVVTPVFRDTKGKDFMYVLVPVRDDK